MFTKKAFCDIIWGRVFKRRGLMASVRKKKPSPDKVRVNLTPQEMKMEKRDASKLALFNIPNEGKRLDDKKGAYKNFFVILSFIVPFLLMYIAFAVHKCQPFGDQQILVTDLWHQYFPYLVDYQDKLQHGQSLLWSWSQGGGTNYLSLIAYYLASPLNFLTILLPSNLFGSNIETLNIYLTFSVAARIGCAGGFCAIFLRYVFKRDDMSLVIFSTGFALSAFFMGYYWCYIWLDTAALTPLVIMGMIALMKERKYRLYIITLALSVLSNYYVGLFTCIFTLLCFIGYNIIEFKGFKVFFKNFLRIAICTTIALMITLALIMPAFFGLQNTHAAGKSFPTQYGINIPAYQVSFDSFGDAVWTTMDGLRHVLANSMSFIEPATKDSDSMPNVACGMVALVFALMFFVSRKIKLREKIFCGGLLVFMGLSFVIRQLDYIWHGFHFTNMIPYRFSYLVSFVVVVMAFRVFHVVQHSTIFDVAITALLTLVFFLLTAELNPEYTLGSGDNAVTINVVLWSAIMAAIVLISLALYSTYIFNKSVMAAILAVIVIVSGSVTAYIGVDTTKTTAVYDYPRGSENTANVVEYMKAEEENTPELWRAEFTSTQTLCDPPLNGFNGVSMFNSVTNESITRFMQNFGLMGWLSGNRYTYAESSPVSNLFMNLKYIIARDGNYNNGEFLSEVKTEGNVKLLKNTAYLPMGFMTGKSLLHYEGEDDEDTYNPFDKQNDFFKRATGVKDDVYERVQVVNQSHTDYSQFHVNLPYEGAYGSYTFSCVDSTVKPHLHWNYTAPKSGWYYAYTRITDGDNVTIYKNGAVRDGTSSFYVKRPYIMAIGYYEEGETISVHCELEENASGSAQIYVNYFNADVFRQGYTKLTESVMTTTSLSGSSMEGTIDVKEDGLFFTSIPFEDGQTEDDALIGKLFGSKSEGWTAYVDGEEVEITPVANAMVAFKLGKGQHTIRLQFIPKGFIKGMICTCTALLLFILYTLFLFLWRKKKLPRKLLDKLPERTEKEYTIL